MPTILELFKNSDISNQVKSDTETLVEQETTGIRVKSAVELNNPILYGDEALRISTRTTSLVQDMKGNSLNNDGSINLTNRLSEFRDNASTFLGIPQTYIPTRLVDKINELPSTEPITRDIVSGNSSGLGEILKNSRGGTPKTILRNVAGGIVNDAKDQFREFLFGSNQTAPQNSTKQGITIYGDKTEYPTGIDASTGQSTDINNSDLEGLTYSTYLKGERDYLNEGGSVQDGAPDIKFANGRVDLRQVSPIYGITRKDGNEYNTPNSKYSDDDDRKRNSLDRLRGFRTRNADNPDIEEVGDIFNRISPYDKYNIEGDTVEFKGGKYRDLVPFRIGRYPADSSDTNEMLFRTIITGLTETISPSWNSSNFIGNPYKYYIFESSERSVAFTLSMYCNSPEELGINWAKITRLSKFSYPNIINNLSNPSFIKFTLGDIYRNKVGFIESLTYTFPDNGTWETDIDGMILPKFIDIAMSIKFVENINDGTVQNLYGYRKSNMVNGGRSAQPASVPLSTELSNSVISRPPENNIGGLESPNPPTTFNTQNIT